MTLQKWCIVQLKDENGDRRYVINEKEAAIVREAFDHYISCGSMAATSIWLRENYDIYKTQKSLRWFLFGNSMYIGKKEMRPQNASYVDDSSILYTIENHCPAIIDHRTWDVAQSMMKAKDKYPKRRKHDYVFSSLLRCKRCGKSITPYPTTKKRADGSEYLYKSYRCPVARTPSAVSDRITCSMKKTITKKNWKRRLWLR